MSNSLMTSLSGLKAYNEQISVISNNIANSGTTAYKASSVSFADLLNQSLSASATATSGAGVVVNDIITNWTQGSTTSTESATDLTINGNGFFIVKNDNGVTYYTRNGSFDFDSSHKLVSSTGLNVQGYKLDQKGNLGTLGDIVVSFDSSEPVATSEMSVSVSLNSEMAESGTFSTTSVVYDSLGNEIPITITYTKSATDNEWTWAATIDAEYGTLEGDSSGTLTFGTDGILTNGTDPEFTLNLTNGATSSQSITWDLYNDSGTTNGSLVQYSGDCILKDSSQNGSRSASLTSVSVNEEGVIIGSYSDGATKELYQIALANFSDYDGLKDVGSSLYEATVDSGDAVIGAVGTGQFGSISSQSLEASNIDLTTELAKLITAERAYQACARVFSISDEIMETTISMK
jgi:flagellar hook protein FlgE